MDIIGNKVQLRLGVVHAGRFCFDWETADRNKLDLEMKLKELDIDFISSDPAVEPKDGKYRLLIDSNEEAYRVSRYFKESGVDAVMLHHANFGTEGTMAIVAKETAKPVVLWGSRDPGPNEHGIRPVDIWCGLQATPYVLQLHGIEQFYYIPTCTIDDPVFSRCMNIFLGAVNAARSFHGAKVLEVGKNPEIFQTVWINRAELLTKFGIELIPVELTDLFTMVKEKVQHDSSMITGIVLEMKERYSMAPEVTDTHLKRLAALKLTLLELVEQTGAHCVAFKCHDTVPPELDIYSCWVHGELSGMGIPVSCETDVHGALSSLLLQKAGMNRQPTFFADLTIPHPENRNAFLLWHCGPASYRLAEKPAEARLSGHYIIFPDGKCPGCQSFRIKGENITISRLGLSAGGSYKLMMGQGKAVKGPYNQGTYLWCEVPDLRLWEQRLAYGPYIHHVSVIPDMYLSASLYLAAWKFIPGVEADPFQPDREQLMASLRGEALHYMEDS